MSARLTLTLPGAKFRALAAHSQKKLSEAEAEIEILNKAEESAIDADEKDAAEIVDLARQKVQADCRDFIRSAEVMSLIGDLVDLGLSYDQMKESVDALHHWMDALLDNKVESRVRRALHDKFKEKLAIAQLLTEGEK